MCFHYFNERIRFSTHLEDTLKNWENLTYFLDGVGLKISQGTFCFAKTFYWLDDAVKARFSRLEGNHYTEPNHVLFGDVAEAYSRDEIPRFSVTKQMKYRSTLKTHILPYFKNLPLTSITTMEVEIFISKMRRQNWCNGHNPSTKPLALKTVMACITVMRDVWKSARRHHNWILHDPFPGLYKKIVERAIHGSNEPTNG